MGWALSWMIAMGKKKPRIAYCWSCKMPYDLNKGGWIILLSKELICSDNQDCWHKVLDYYQAKKERGLTDEKKAVR